ncbi:MAG: hypothetical protein UW95_C0031G0006 [Parcubacteria group bacterium GW2011_GWC1_45_14]|nr:MAG: hypothetical protein UW87_C0031G0013 [Candidatus Moranbacteria bacterium GW2011_GWC2_45_10]KKT92621.1 MAG: hypothetical protein UW95_C0031G0006 [Parcubacteria group bacterium GW2011_GWC1_45_14]
MSKVKVHQIDPKERRRIVGELLDVVSGIKSRDEMFELLFRLMTPSEVVMLARRLQIAKMILADSGYEMIQKKLHVSHRTIADVEGWLRENDNRAGLLGRRLQSVKKHEKSKHSESMLDKYAHHRFLKELFG